MLLNPCTIHVPKTLDELRSLYAKLENVRLQAGGTFLLNALKLLKRNGAKTPDHIISLYRVDELKGIEETDEGLKINAMTTIDELFTAELSEPYRILHKVCKNISTQPIRNMATVGGNLTCRYTWTEMPAAMIGLQASLHFITKDGDTAELSAEEFFAQAAKTDHILTHIMIPENKGSTFSYQRIRKSQFVDIPLLSLMINTKIEGGAFSETVAAINNCVAFAQRDVKLEEFLNGSSCDESLADKALEHLTDEIYDKRSDDYKKHMFRLSIKRAVNEIVKDATS